MEYINKEKNIKIIANQINIGNSVSLGNNISISLKGDFQIGDFSRLGDNTHIKGNNVSFGKHLFHSAGLTIGGGGWQNPTANFEIGDRCTIHNNFINICQPVKIGNDVGFSGDVTILTHGFWLSVLDGYPASFSGVKIGDGVIVGFRSTIMMGVEIADYVVIGSNALVSKNLSEKGIYAGVPAKKIKDIEPLNIEQRVKKLEEIIENYKLIAKYHNIKAEVQINYPYISMKDFRFNVENFEYEGTEDIETDDLRDYMRKWGIRIYTNRPFQSKFEI